LTGKVLSNFAQLIPLSSGPWHEMRFFRPRFLRSRLVMKKNPSGHPDFCLSLSKKWMSRSLPGAKIDLAAPRETSMKQAREKNEAESILSLTKVSIFDK
jgi:hypothetical protein